MPILAPRLKSGLRAIPRDQHQLYIGDSREGILLDLIPYLPLVRICTGTLTMQEIASHLTIELDLVETSIKRLLELGVVEMVEINEKVELIERESHLQHHSHSYLRGEIERSLISHRSDDGGLCEWRHRGEFPIEIFGDNRIGRNLLALLSASGFREIKLTLDPRDHTLLQAQDINAMTVTSAHLAVNKARHHAELVRLAQIESDPPLKKSFRSPGAARLVVSTTPPHADSIQQWQSEGQSHLAVSDVVGGCIEISPIISPGGGPCLHCISLHRRDALPSDLAELAIPRESKELPAPAAALIAAMLATHIANYVESNRSGRLLVENSSYSLRINLLDPCVPIARLKWNLHPECGCVDVRRRASPR